MTKPPFKAPTLEELAEQAWFQKAAAEARQQSRRHWVKGGAADREYPVHPDVERMWPLAGDKVPEPPAGQTRRVEGRQWIKRKREEQ
jgi:hypothetical protein